MTEHDRRMAHIARGAPCCTTAEEYRELIRRNPDFRQAVQEYVVGAFVRALRSLEGF